MLPNLAPVFLCLGTMGWLGINLDYTKLFIAGVALGIAIALIADFLMLPALITAFQPVDGGVVYYTDTPLA